MTTYIAASGTNPRVAEARTRLRRLDKILSQA